ncbi:MAG: type IV pilus modification protein PilV [Burkholderiaceae bacterium]|nr:MAG: type IV pilus modification protein PilV [Burkholderiaceae bacterium]
MNRRQIPTPRARHDANQRGDTLIEILVTLMILLFGLLGLVGIIGRANMAELESFQRIQALEIVQDMAARLNANRKVAACYSNFNAGVTLGNVDPPASVPACPLGSVQQQTRAAADLTAWNTLLKGGIEVLSSNAQVGAAQGAIGCITQESANVYLVAVAWQGLAKTAAPTLSDGTVFPCGSGYFGDNTLHRVVTTKVQIGKLS